MMKNEGVKGEGSSCLKTIVVKLFLVGVLVHGVVSNDHQETCLDGDDTCRNSYIDQCQLYLAQSSIPNAGIGVYTSVEYKEGDYIGEGEMLIPIITQEEWLVSDVEWHIDFDDRLLNENDRRYSKSIIYPGFGAQVNSHFGLHNVDHGKAKFDSAGLHRSKDPGVGSFTGWYDIQNIAARDIQPGEELFVYYGEGWFSSRVDLMGAIPKEDDYANADLVVQKLYSTLIEDDDQKNRPVVEDLWEIFQNIGGEALRRALPDRMEELDEVRRYGTARYSVGGLSSIRSQEWLNANGICMDNLYVNISTIPQAGRGAFAKRFLPKDSIVSPVPVLQVNRTFIIGPEVDPPQLLYNYAYGHPDSSVFLIPYGATVNFINHNSQNPNVKLRWSSSPLHQKNFLELSSEEVLRKGFGLLLELTALRDISPDEEILMDYGVEWELAWKRHVEEWAPILGSDNYTTADEAISLMGILTVEEQGETPYPDNVQTACFFAHTEDTAYVDIESDDDHFPAFEVEWDQMNHGCLRWCSILNRSTDENNNEVFYDILLEIHEHFNEDCTLSRKGKIYVNSIPSDAVTLVDIHLSRDQYLPNAFRHYIRLTDDLYPLNWRQNPSESM